MDDRTSDLAAGSTLITVRIPDELARLVGSGSKAQRRVLEALALDEFRQGHLSRAELRRVLGLSTRIKLDEFLAAHCVFGTYTLADLERERDDLRRLGF